MSAIYGIIDFEGRPLKEEWIRSMQADLAHRGPDGQGLYREPSVALGHMLLQVTPESVYDKSPYEEDGFVITANARLDEREAIMDRLNVPQEERDKITDPLLLLRSFRKFGKDFVKDIYGDFAFAIWDKNKRELFCARDQMGVKPFLYYYDGIRFVFSTEIKSIIRLPFINTKPDHHFLQTTSFGLTHEPQRTAWVNIFRLKSAHTFIIIGKSIMFNHYWMPIYRESKLYKSEKESALALKHLVSRVITDHTKVSAPVGVPLSGGLDSSTIACFAAKRMKELNQKLHAVSSVMHPEQRGVTADDEYEYIQAVLKQEKNIFVDFIYNTNLNLLENLDLKFDKQYIPVNYFHYLDDAIFRQFQSRSIRRVLSGLIGDETISTRFIMPLPYLLLTGKIFRYLNLSRKLLKNNSLDIIKFIRINTLNPLLRLLFHSNRQVFCKLVSEWENSILPVSLSDLTGPLNKKKFFNLGYTLKQRQVIIDTIWAPDFEFFPEEYDCCPSHYQLELSYPFADRRIVEFLMMLPVEHFLAGGINRGLIRKMTEGILPEIVRKREDKQAYSPDFHGIFSRSIVDIKKILRDHTTTDNSKFTFDFSKMIILLENLEKQDKEVIFDAKYWIINNLSILSLYYIWLYKN